MLVVFLVVIVMVDRREGAAVSPFVEYFFDFDVVPVSVLVDEVILKDC